MSRASEMQALTLVLPDARLKEEYRDLLQEWKATGEELIPWSLNLDYENFEAYVEELQGFREGKGLPGGYVPFTVFWLINVSGRILGFIEVRHQLNDFLSFRGGHIGYGIRPCERGKGLAVKMLGMALAYCRYIGLHEVLITCDRKNIASRKTIERNGGILDSEDSDQDGNAFLRYWIRMNEARDYDAAGKEKFE